MLHHGCECPTCRFKDFNYEQMKDHAILKNALLLEAAQYLDETGLHEPVEPTKGLVVAPELSLASRLRAAARI